MKINSIHNVLNVFGFLIDCALQIHNFPTHSQFCFSKITNTRNEMFNQKKNIVYCMCYLNNETNKQKK